MAKILLDNLTKVFDGGVTAVSNLSLEVPDGRFVVIVGPSGCGKTTVLRLIAGLEEPTSGDIYIADTLVNDLPPKQRDVAMVFQNYALYPHMTVYQNMAFGLKAAGLNRDVIKTRIEDTARLLGIESLLHRRPHTLSGGQRQRVALGRAVVRKCNVFLFDEPLSNLDAALRTEMRSEIKALHQRLHTTCIYVTHDQAEAMTLGEQICVMLDGAVQQTGSPLSVYDRPVNRFVAGFLGTPGMNFFDGRVEFRDDAPRFILGDNAVPLPQRTRTVLGPYHGRQMVLGIRPQNLSLYPFSSQAEVFISATVNLIEPLGDRTDIHLSCRAKDKFVASIDPHTAVKADDAVRIHLDLDKAHIFEPGDNGQNVTLPEEDRPRCAPAGTD